MYRVKFSNRLAAFKNLDDDDEEEEEEDEDDVDINRA